MPNNTLLTPDQITKHALMILHQKLTFISTIHRGYDDSFAKDGAKIGDNLRIRLPNQYVVRDGPALVTQDTQERFVNLKVDNQKGVDVNFTSVDLTLDMEEFSKRIIEPAMSTLAASIEAEALTMRRDVYQQVGTTGTPVAFRDFLKGRQALVDSLAPGSKRHALLNTTDNVDLVDTLKGLFQDSKNIAMQYREGYMGRTGGFDFAETTHLTDQMRGDGAGYLTDGVDQTGNSIVVGAGTGTINAGEVVTFDGVYRVHPETKAITTTLQQFTVTADFAGGAGALSVSPAIEATGAYQNVSNAVGDASPVNIAGTAAAPGAPSSYSQSLVYEPEAFTFATADLIKPKGVDMCSRNVLDGISMRLIRDYDINSDQFPCRLDVLYGYQTIRPQLAARIASN